MACRFLLTIATMGLASITAVAYDPSPLDDFCVGVKDFESSVCVNEKICKNPNIVKAEDFFFSGLNKQGSRSNQVGSFVNLIDINQFPRLNTLGISIERIDFAKKGLNPPHSHPHASEFLWVVKSKLDVGFVTSDPANPNQENKLFTKTLYPGDDFLFTQGLIHFQINTGNSDAAAFAALGSQNPGRVTLDNAVFKSNPTIPFDVLTKAFQDSVFIKSPEDQYVWENNN